MKCIGGCSAVFSLILLATSSARATQTSFPAKECTGTCTAAQMLTEATHMPLGIVFVYDLGHAVIRQFDVYMDSTCGVPLSTEGLGGSGSGKEGDVNASEHAARQGGVNCGSFKTAIEDPVSTDALVVFQALVGVKQLNPQLVLTAAAEHQGSLPFDTVTGKPFNLPNVAWEFPNGTYGRFASYIATQLANETSGNNFAPGLGTYLYSWQQRSRTASVQVGTTLVSGSITWDRNNSTTLDICNPDNDCAEFLLTNPNNTGPVAMNFVGVFDAQHNPYPSPNANGPASPNWIWRAPHGGGGSFHFSQGLRGNGVQILDSSDGCGQNADYFLSCAWQGTHLIGCNLSCN